MPSFLTPLSRGPDDRRSSGRAGPATGLALVVALAACAPALAADSGQGLPAPLLVGAVSKPDESIQPLPAGAADLFLQGEFDTREWPVFVPAVQVARPATLQLALSSAISVLPERSRIEVSVNGESLIEGPLGMASKDQVLSAPVPPGLLQAGFNAVRITVHQQHRVDCTLAGSYELWTRLDPARTGLVRPAGGSPTAGTRTDDLAQIGAVEADMQGVTRIRIRQADPADAIGLSRAMQAVQALVLAGHLPRPVVEVAEAPGTGPGLDVAVGLPGELGELGLADPASSGLQTRPGARPIFVVSAQSAPALRLALQELGTRAQKLVPPGSPEGLNALVNRAGRQAGSDSRFSFAELGLGTQEFGGRFLQTGFRLRLPADFLSAGYGHASLVLNGKAGRDLAAADRINVWVNGSNVAGVDLPRDGSQGGDGSRLIRRQAIGLPLGVFRPGLNDVRLEATTLTEADRTCEQAATGDTRLMLDGSSEIVFPTLARVARLPDLSTALAGGLIDPERGAAIFVPGADPKAVGTAATLVANMAALHGAAVPAEFRFERPPVNGRGLVVGALGQLSGQALARVHALLPAQSKAATARTTDPIDSWADWATETVLRPLQDRGLVYGWDRRGVPPAMPADGVAAVQSVELSGQPWARFAGYGTLDAAWSVFTATTADSLSRGVEALVAGDHLGQLAGEVATFDRASGAVQARYADTALYLQTQPASLGNLHLFAAGFVSNDVPTYVGLLVLLCILLGVTTRLLLNRVGERP